MLRVYTHVGIHLSLKGVVYANNSVIPITEIGRTTTNATLQCITDSMPFYCQQVEFGFYQTRQWCQRNLKMEVLYHFIQIMSTDGAVAMLNRADMMPSWSPAGLFCCRESV